MKYFIKTLGCQMDKIILVLLILFFLLGITQPIHSLTKILLFGKLIDFEVYYQAARRALSGNSPYLAQENVIAFNYPPASLFLFIPFSFPPLFYGQIAWTIFSASCLGLSIHFLFKCLDLKLGLRRLLLIIPLITLAFPVKWTFGMGQVNHLILLLLVSTFYFYKRGKKLWSGVSLGLAVILKLTPIVLLGLFLIKKKWKVASCSLATILSLTLLSGLFFGPGLIPEYFLKVMPGLFSGAGKEIYYNQSISGLIARLIADNNLRFYLSFLCSFLILGFSYWLVAEKEELTELDYSLLIIVSLLINSISWQHHFVLAVFPFLALLTFLKEQKANYGSGLLLMSYFLISFNIKNPAVLKGNFLEPFILSHVFFGALIIFGLLFYFLSRQDRLKK